MVGIAPAIAAVTPAIEVLGRVVAWLADQMTDSTDEIIKMDVRSQAVEATQRELGVTAGELARQFGHNSQEVADYNARVEFHEQRLTEVRETAALYQENLEGLDEAVGRAATSQAGFTTEVEDSVDPMDTAAEAAWRLADAYNAAFGARNRLAQQETTRADRARDREAAGQFGLMSMGGTVPEADAADLYDQGWVYDPTSGGLVLRNENPLWSPSRPGGGGGGGGTPPKTAEDIAEEKEAADAARFDKSLEALFAGDRISEDQLKTLQDSEQVQKDLMAAVQLADVDNLAALDSVRAQAYNTGRSPPPAARR